MSDRKFVKYQVIDVFTSTSFGGNPAGVVLEPAGLTKNLMQKIAREINISNTTFLFPPKENGDVNVRFFTPDREISICGHSSIATFFAWGKENLNRLNDGANIVLMETNIGVLPVYIKIIEGKVDFVTITLPSPKFIPVSITRRGIAKALNISEDLIVSKFPIEIVYDGLYFLEVGFNERETLLEITPSFNDLINLSEKLKLDSIQVFTLDTVHSDSTMHSRTFFPILGVNEDPVCGTGNAALASYLIKNKLIKITKPTTTVIGEQGYSMSRPGTVTVLVDLIDDVIQRLRIRGKSIEVLNGNIIIEEVNEVGTT